MLNSTSHSINQSKRSLSTTATFTKTTQKRPTMQFSTQNLSETRQKPPVSQFPFVSSHTAIHLASSHSNLIITLTNRSNTMQRIIIMPFETPYFTARRLEERNSGDIAPGMSLRLEVRLNDIIESEKYADTLRLKASSKQDMTTHEMEIEVRGGNWSKAPELRVRRDLATAQSATRGAGLTQQNLNDSLRSQLNPQKMTAADFSDDPRAFQFTSTCVRNRVDQRFIVENVGERGAQFHWCNNFDNRSEPWTQDGVFYFCGIERSENALGTPESVQHDASGKTRFHLEPFEQAYMHFAFVPPQCDAFHRTLYLVNDETSDVYEFQLSGEGVWPELMRENLNEALPLPSTRFFPEIYSKAQAELVEQYVNLSDAPVEFHWEIFILLQQDTNSAPEVLSSRLDMPTPFDSPFQVSPASGVIDPHESQQFVITFQAPTGLSSRTQYDAYLALFMDGIPVPVTRLSMPPQDTEQHTPVLSITDDSAPISFPFEHHFQADAQRFFTEKLNSQIASSDPHHLFQTPEMLYEEFLDTRTQPPRHYPSRDEISKLSLCTSFIKVHATALPAPIKLSHQNLLFGLPLTIGTVTEKQFEVINSSNVDTSFSFGDNIISDYFSAQFIPNEGKLPANSKVSVKFYFLPKTIGEISSAFQCHLKDNVHEALVFRIRAIVKGPVLYVDSPMIDFGVSEVGKSLSTTVRLTNASESGLNFMFGSPGDTDEEDIQLQMVDAEGSTSPYMVSFEPSGYHLAPYESLLVNVHLTCARACSLHYIVPIYVEFGETAYITVRGDVQEAKVLMEEHVVDMGVTYVDTQSQTTTLTMKNVSSLETTFYWYTDEVNQDEDFQISVVPQAGTIPPGETFDVKVTTLATSVGEFERIVPCFFQDDRENYSGIVVRTQVKGLSVQVFVTEENAVAQDATPAVPVEDSLKNIVENCVQSALNEPEQVVLPTVDFGTLQLGAKPGVLSLKLKKLSNMLAFFSLQYQNYQAPVVHSRRQTKVSFHGESAAGSAVSQRSSAQPKNKRRSSKVSSARSGSLTIRSALSAKSTKRKPLISTQAAPFQSKSATLMLKTQEKQKKDDTFFEEALSNGYGCAFDASLLNGRLDNALTSVDLLCFSNAPGVYKDKLLLEIQPLPPMYMDVHARVVGCPVQLLQKTLGLRPMKDAISKENPTLVWPTVEASAQSGSVVKKTLHVQNTSIDALEMTWVFVPNQHAINTQIRVNPDTGKIEVVCEENEIEYDNDEALAQFGIPFSFEPAQCVIQPGEVQTFVVTYEPRLVPGGEDAFQQQQFHDCCMKSKFRYVTERKYPPNVPAADRASREQDVECLQPLRLQMTGTSILPELDAHTKCIKFKCSVYDAQEAQTSESFTKSVTLSNPTSAPLSFTMSFVDDKGSEKNASFKLLDVTGGQHPLSRDTGFESRSVNGATRKLSALKTSTSTAIAPIAPSRRKLSQNLSKSMFQLKPGEEMQLQALVRPELLSNIRHEYDLQAQPFRSRVSHPGKLLIKFSSGHVQEVPTELMVHYPVISTNVESVDFGLVGRNPVTRAFRIINYSTVSKANWRIIEPKQHQRVFYIYSGADSELGKAHGVTAAHSSTEVTITFRPRASKQYDMSILVQVANGRHLSLNISGTGNLDELAQGDEDEIEAVEMSRRQVMGVGRE